MVVRSSVLVIQSASSHIPRGSTKIIIFLLVVASGLD